MPPKPCNLIIPFLGPSFPLTLLAQQQFKKYTAFELRLDDQTVIRRVIFFDDVLHCWVEGISRRGPGVDLLPVVTKLPAAYLSRVTVSAINPEHFEAWLRQVPATVRAVCSERTSTPPVVAKDHDKVDAPFSQLDSPAKDCVRAAPSKDRVPIPCQIPQQCDHCDVMRCDIRSMRNHYALYHTPPAMGGIPLPEKWVAMKYRPRSSDDKEPQKRNRSVDVKIPRPYPSTEGAISPPSSDDEQESKTITCKGTDARPARRAARHPMSDDVEELRSCIDYLETRLEVVELRSRRHKSKLNAVLEFLKRNGMSSAED